MFVAINFKRPIPVNKLIEVKLIKNTHEYSYIQIFEYISIITSHCDKLDIGLCPTAAKLINTPSIAAIHSRNVSRR